MGKRKSRLDADIEIEETPDIKQPLGKNAYGSRIEIEIERAIISLTTQRGCDKTCCPSEIPRLILKFPNWREYMDLTRAIAFRMAASGTIEITQKGTLIDPSTQSSFTGIMRLRLPKKNENNNKGEDKNKNKENL